MEIDELKRQWESFGSENPLWAVHTGEGTVVWDERAFFRTGEERIAKALQLVESAGLEVKPDRALDFGCGVGRLSLALASRFDRVDGVDISEPMLDHAEAYVAALDPAPSGEIRFHLNTADDLALFPDRTFTYAQTFVTLQHMNPRYSRRYMAELCRVTATGGILVFQMTAQRKSRYLKVRGAIGRTVRRLRSRLGSGGAPVMEMYGLPPTEVQGLIEAHGLNVVRVEPDLDAGPTWESFTYVATRG